MKAFSPELLAGLRESLKLAQGRASDERRQASDSRVSVARHLRNAADQDAQAAQYRDLLRHADPKNAAAYADPRGTPDAQEWSLRAARIAGAREVIDFLEVHPELPVDVLSSFHLFPHLEGESANEQAVDRFAGVMGVPSGREAPNNHYKAIRKFGPDGAVSLEAVTCGRTDTSWHKGDPFPDWWPTPEAVDAAQQLVAPTDTELEADEREVEAATQAWHAAGADDDSELEASEYDLEMELAVQAAAEAVDDGLCGARAVNLNGDAGRCTLPDGHWDPDSAAYDCGALQHCDPRFGRWDEPAAPGGGAVLDERMHAMDSGELGSGRNRDGDGE